MNPSQTVKRRVKPEARAGHYMCAECGKIFDTKKEVDSHRRKKHGAQFKSVHDAINGLYTE